MKLKAKEIALFGLLGAIMYVQKIVLAALPNIHLSAVLIVAITVVYRVKALYPIYVYVFLEGLFGGFSILWVPYLYVWAILWGVTMLLPKSLSEKRYGVIVYMAICSLHGFLFGALCAPAEAIMMGLDFKGMIGWIAAGFSFDAIHGISNFVLGSLTVPLIKLLKRIKTINFH